MHQLKDHFDFYKIIQYSKNQLITQKLKQRIEDE